MDGWQPEILLSSVLWAYWHTCQYIEYAGYLNIMYIPGSEELGSAPLSRRWSVSFGTMLSLEVFIDTGNLTIGGILAVNFAIIIHRLWVLFSFGNLWFRNLSVILWWYIQKREKKDILTLVFKRAYPRLISTLAQLDLNCSYLFMKPNIVFHESKITLLGLPIITRCNYDYYIKDKINEDYG